MRYILLGLFVCCTALTVTAQEPVTLDLTLANTVELARTQSLAALATENRYQTGYWQYRLFQANYRPSLTLNSTFPDLNRSIQRVIQPDGTEIFVPRSLTTSSVDLGISQRIRWTGGNVSVRTGMERIDLLGANSGTSYLAVPVVLGLRQPLFGHNPFRWENQVAPLQFQEAQQRFREELEEISLEAVNRFFDLHLAQMNLEIAQNNVANNDTLMNLTRGRYNLGRIGENELLQMELQALNAEADLERSRLEVQLAGFRLKRFLNLPENIGIRLLPPTDVPNVQVDMELALAEARLNRSQSVRNQRQMVEVAAQVDQAYRENMFQADLFANIGLTNSAANLADVYRSPQDFQRVSVGIQVPILDWGKGRANLEIARSNQELMRNMVEQDLINFEQEVILQVSQFQLQKNQLRIAAKADTVAQKRYEVSVYRYVSGKVGITDLNLAVQEKDLARRQNIATLRDYWLNYYNMRRITL